MYKHVQTYHDIQKIFYLKNKLEILLKKREGHKILNFISNQNCKRKVEVKWESGSGY